VQVGQPCKPRGSARHRSSFPARTRLLKLMTVSHSGASQMQEPAGRCEEPQPSQGQAENERAARSSPRLRWASPKIALLSTTPQTGQACGP